MLNLIFNKYQEKSSYSLPGGKRAKFVLDLACEKGHVIRSIRCHQMRNMLLEDYAKANKFSDLKSDNNSLASNPDEKFKALYQQGNWLGCIKTAVLARNNIIISGGTGKGKTAFLNACLKSIPDNENLLTIEHIRKVQLTQPNAAELLAAKNQQGVAKISTQDLFEWRTFI